jgi:hypothetical protein
VRAGGLHAFSGGPPALWISLPIAACVCLLVALAAAALSATFPGSSI